MERDHTKMGYSCRVSYLEVRVLCSRSFKVGQACSAGEISEVVLYHAIRKSHRLTSHKAVFPSKNANTSVVSFYCALHYALEANYVDTKEQ